MEGHQAAQVCCSTTVINPTSVASTHALQVRLNQVSTVCLLCWLLSSMRSTACTFAMHSSFAKVAHL